MTLNGFGVQLDGNSLVVKASAENFPVRKHNLIQAMLSVNDLFYTAKPIMMSLFFEDVVEWLDSNDIRYTPRVKLTGKSGFDHMYDFVIPKSRSKPERILQTVNRPSREVAERFVFSWVDTRDARDPESLAVAILNDEIQKVPAQTLEALKEYAVIPVVWSKRDEAKQLIAA
jgi:hypothetical protein